MPQISYECGAGALKFVVSLDHARADLCGRKLIMHSDAPDARVRSAVTVLLTHHQIALMDGDSSPIRHNKGTVISRSTMLRAIAAAVLPYYQDWLYCCTYGP